MEQHALTTVEVTRDRRVAFHAECSCGWTSRTRCASNAQAWLIADAHAVVNRGVGGYRG